MNHSAIVQPGSNMCVCGMPDDHPVHGFVEWVPKCRADRQCMAREHDRNCPQAIALELAAERGKNRRDLCDSCGKHAVVTDVWIEGTPMTLCQPCVLDALTAEGESLGQYWEIEP